MKAKIAGIVSQFVYPNDREVRARKIAHTLRDAGYQVHILCNSDGKKFNFIDEDGNIVHRINVLWQVPFIHRILGNTFPINPIWYFWIFVTCWKNKIDLMLVRDFRLSLPGMLVGKILGLKNWIDLGENFPALYKVMGYNKIYIYISLLLEKLVCNLSDKILVVTEEAKQRLEDEYAISPNKIIVLPNVPWNSLINDWGSTIPVQTFLTASEELKLVFLGLVDKLRGLELLLDVMTNLNQLGVKNKLTIIGEGKHLSIIKNIADLCGLKNQIDYLGWISSEKYDLLRRQHIGLIPHIKSEFTQTTLPNKLFDYMSVGLPIVSTDLYPVASIINKCQCGWIVKYDPSEMAQLLFNLVKKPDELFEKGQNGYRQIRIKYNWDFQAKIAFQDII